MYVVSEIQSGPTKQVKIMGQRPAGKTHRGLKTASASRFRLCLPLAVIAIALLSSCGLDHKATGPFGAPNLPNVFDAYSEPAWHPSGRVLIFNHTPLVKGFYDPSSQRYIQVFAESLSGLWTVNLDGTGQRRLLPFNAWTPDWDSSGTTLAYMQGSHIWSIAGSDTGVVQTSATQLTFGGLGEFAPSWTPDATSIAYCVNAMPDAGIYLVPRTGGTSRKVGDLGWSEPDWSPKGDSLVFWSSWNSSIGVGVADSSGHGSRMLWGGPQAFVSYPRWSPAGGIIAFTGRANNTGSYQLWVMRTDGSNAHAVTTEGVQEFFSWSPDGKEIAYVRSAMHDTSLVNGTIWIINPLTGVKRQVTFNTPSN